MNRLILATCTALTALPGMAAARPQAHPSQTASAAAKPYTATPCSGDPRMLCVDYQPDRTLELSATPGATIKIDLGPGETPQQVLVSDQRIMDNEDPTQEEPKAGLVSTSVDVAPSTAATVPSCDPNICRFVIGHSVFIKPLRDLGRQPLFVHTQYCAASGNCQDLDYSFELLTHPATEKDGMLGAVFGVRFRHPDRDAAAKRAVAEKAAAASAERRAMVRPPPSVPEPASNWRYVYRGSAELKPDEVWDDGRSTFVRYNGLRRIPNPYGYLPDGTETLLGYATEPGPTGTVIRIGRTEGRFCLRDGAAVGCLFNAGPDPNGAASSTVAGR